MAKRLKRYCLFPVFYSLLATGATFAQTQGQKNAFVGPNLEYLEFRNDTSLVTNLKGDWDTTAYLIRSDTLFVKNEQWQTGPDGDHHWVDWLGYKLLFRETDTISLLNLFRGHVKPIDWKDTLTLVSLKNSKEPIRSFGYLKVVEENPWTGITNISIDSTGKIVYYREMLDMAHHPNNKPTIQATKRMLSKLEFSKFKVMLSYSFPSKLKRFRGGCDAMDAGRTTFEIAYNDKKIVSNGCNIKWPHALLFDYLYELANKPPQAGLKS